MATAGEITSVILVILFALSEPVLASNQTEFHVGRDRDMEDMMKSVYSSFMVAKNMMSLVTMVWTPFIQFKGFLLSFLGVLINLSRLVLQMRALDRMEHMQKKQMMLMSDHHMPDRMSHQQPHTIKYIVRDYGGTEHQQKPHYEDTEDKKDVENKWGEDHANSWVVKDGRGDSWSAQHSQYPWDPHSGVDHRQNQVRRYVSPDSHTNAAYRI